MGTYNKGLMGAAIGCVAAVTAFSYARPDVDLSYDERACVGSTLGDCISDLTSRGITPDDFNAFDARMSHGDIIKLHDAGFTAEDTHGYPERFDWGVDDLVMAGISPATVELYEGLYPSRIKMYVENNIDPETAKKLEVGNVGNWKLDSYVGEGFDLNIVAQYDQKICSHQIKSLIKNHVPPGYANRLSEEFRAEYCRDDNFGTDEILQLYQLAVPVDFANRMVIVHEATQNLSTSNALMPSYIAILYNHQMDEAKIHAYGRTISDVSSLIHKGISAEHSAALPGISLRGLLDLRDAGISVDLAQQYVSVLGAEVTRANVNHYGGMGSASHLTSRALAIQALVENNISPQEARPLKHHSSRVIAKLAKDPARWNRAVKLSSHFDGNEVLRLAKSAVPVSFANAIAAIEARYSVEYSVEEIKQKWEGKVPIAEIQEDARIIARDRKKQQSPVGL